MAAGLDLSSWLTQAGLGQYLSLFESNDIDGEVLVTLSEQDLANLGIASFGHRRKLATMIAELVAAEKLTSLTKTAPLAEAATESGERRNLTVMFCDLVGDAALSGRLDPEEHREIMRAYRETIRETIGPFQGVIAQFLGDGALIYFGYPQSSGHDAETAVAAGLAMLSRFAGRRDVRDIAVRIGVATGMCVVEEPTAARSAHGDAALGEIPNLAAQMQALAEPQSIMIADSTRRLIGDLFDCSDLGFADVKGFARPIRAWRVLGHNRGATRFDALRRGGAQAAFFGREQELIQIEELRAKADADEGQILIISGESGIGKSRLARQVCDPAGGVQGAPTLQCAPYHTGTPFFPFRRLIDQMIALRGEQSLAKLEDRLAHLPAAAALDPAQRATLADFLAAAANDQVSASPLSSQERRESLMSALMSLMSAILNRNRVLLLEDAQWLDPSSAELMERLAPLLRQASILFIVTTTALPVPQAAWLEAGLCTVVRLDKLAAEAVRGLVRHVATGRTVSNAVIDVILDRADGIPIFAEELTRGYLEAAEQEEEVADQRAKIPATLSGALLSRLDRLEQGRDIALQASVIAREFPIDLLIAVVEAPAKLLRAAVQELIQVSILVPGNGRYGETVAFRHALVREAAYQLILPKRRLALHARVARALVEEFPQIVESYPQLAALHLTEAQDFSQASRAWEKAGYLAASRSAYGEAIEHCAKAIDANARLPESRERDEREISLRLDMIGALSAGRGISAHRLIDQVEMTMSLSAKIGARHNLVPVLWSQWMLMGSASKVTESAQLAQKIRDVAAGGGEIDRLMAHRTVGTSAVFGGKLEEAKSELSAFLALYDEAKHGEALNRIGASSHLMMVMAGLAEIAALQRDHEALARWTKEIFALGETRNRLHDRYNAMNFAGCLLPALVGDIKNLNAHAALLSQMAEEHNRAHWRAHANLFIGLGQFRDTGAHDGLQLARRGVEALIWDDAPLSPWYMLYADACQDAGLWQEAEAVFARSAMHIRQGEIWFAAEHHRLLGRHALECLKDADAARGEFETALNIATAQAAWLLADRARQSLKALAGRGDQPLATRQG